MALSFKKFQAYVKSPQAKKLIAQARKLDTPENRKKAMAVAADVRKKAEPAAKAAIARVTERKKRPIAPKPRSGAPTPPA